MGIERRNCDRVPVDFEIAVHYRDRQGLPAKAINVSSEGMFLRSNQRLADGTLVYLVFSLEGMSWHIPALVVHQRDEGVGVMFRVPQPELCEYVRRLSGAVGLPAKKQKAVPAPGVLAHA